MTVSELLHPRILPEYSLSFRDVRIVPCHTDVLPQQVSLKTNLGKGLVLNLPIFAAGMDTICENRMATTVARAGGSGVIHGKLGIEAQCMEVWKVKNNQPNLLVNPIVMYPTDTVGAAIEKMETEKIGGIPVVEKQTGHLLGMFTESDRKRVTSTSSLLGDVMKPVDQLKTVEIGTSVEEGLEIIRGEGLKKLPVLKDGRLAAMIVAKDRDVYTDFPNACVDANGRLRVGAAVFVTRPYDRMLQRAKTLIAIGVDYIVIDASVGNSEGVIGATQELRKNFPDLYIIAGNVVEPDGTGRLIKAGANVVKVGYGPGSTCTSDDVVGSGVGQFTATLWCADIAHEFQTPIITDGGFEVPGDIVKALAGGASAIMTGFFLRATNEVPPRAKVGDNMYIYRGMGALEVVGDEGRYSDEDPTLRKVIPEGVSAIIPGRGPAAKVLFELQYSLQAALALIGVSRIPSPSEPTEKAELWQRKFIRLTEGGLHERQQRIKKDGES